VIQLGIFKKNYRYNLDCDHLRSLFLAFYVLDIRFPIGPTLRVLCRIPWNTAICSIPYNGRFYLHVHQEKDFQFGQPWT
jgi:hypothetical protein